MNAEAPTPVIDFTTYYRRETRWSSIVLFLFVAANFMTAFSYRHWLLDLPSPAPAAIWIIEWGVIVPACLLVAFVRHRWSEAPWATTATLAGVFAIAAALIAERATWIGAGAPFFSVLNCYFLTAVIVMTGVAYARVLLIALPILVAECALSYSIHGWGPHANYDMLSFMTAGIILLFAGWQVERGMRRAWSEGRYFETLSQRDPLTGLMNRRGFDERASRLVAQAERERRSLALAVLDLDAFKSYNDCYGHPAGDRALIRLAQVFAGFAKGPLDFAARIGGEEFVLAWYDVTAETVHARVTDVVEALRKLQVPHRGSGAGLLTISVGARFVPAGGRADLAALLQGADDNLYAAKQEGGNRGIVTIGEAGRLPAVAR